MVLTIALIAVLAAYVGGTYIKAAGIAQDKLAGMDRFDSMMKRHIAWESIWENMAIDMSYRMACLEFPAAILGSQMDGKDCLWGEAFSLGFIGALPSFLSTGVGLYNDKFEEKEQVESTICKHFGLPDVDQTGSILASAVADFGSLGIFILFPLLALFHGKFLVRIYLNPTTTMAYFGALSFVMRFDHYIDTQLFDILKFLGLMCLLFLPFTAWGDPQSHRENQYGRDSTNTVRQRVMGL
jgi:hypothetical protein